MLTSLIEQLSQPEAYPHPAEDLQVHQTHISVVFLAGEYAYKLKKPIDLEFVDYSTFERRLHFCGREVELNERLAPDVYLDVAGIVDDDGLRIDLDADPHDEQVIECAVRMRRLDERDTLLARFERGAIPPGLFERLGRRLAQFHDDAEHGSHIDEYARFSVVEKNALDNFEQARNHVGQTVHPDVFDRLEQKIRQTLEQLQPLISQRADAGAARDTHGDLRLEHVYVTDGVLRIVDCIEFNEAFRYADPVSDIAFLAMDLGIRGWDDEADQLLDTYFHHCGDEQGRQLLDFYVSYRSCVRAKVHGFKAMEPEVPSEKRQLARQKARAHWLYALAAIEAPARGPRLWMLAGLPAAGKSTLGRRLIDQDRLDVILDSDVVRKQLAGLTPDESADADIGEGIYTPDFSEKTYTELARRAADHLQKGRRVGVAATFVSDRRRLQLLEVARRLGVPVRFVECKIPDDLARRRLEARTGDASDADIEVYEHLKDAWEPPSPPIARIHEVRHTG